MAMPSGFKAPAGSVAKRSTLPRSHAAASKAVRKRNASRNNAVRVNAGMTSSPGRFLTAQSVPTVRPVSTGYERGFSQVKEIEPLILDIVAMLEQRCSGGGAKKG